MTYGCPPSGTVICPANAVEPEQTRGFVISDPHSTKYLDLIIWHTPDGFRGFVNKRPHLGLPLKLDVRPRHHAKPTVSESPANVGKLADAGADKDIVLIGRLAHS